MAKYPPIDQKLKQDVLSALGDGKRAAEIAKEFSITEAKVYYIKRSTALNGQKEFGEIEEVLIPNEVAGHRSFIAKASQSREDALDAIWRWKTMEKDPPPEIVQYAIDVANGAANAWRKAVLELENRRKK